MFPELSRTEMNQLEIEGNLIRAWKYVLVLEFVKLGRQWLQHKFFGSRGHNRDQGIHNGDNMQIEPICVMNSYNRSFWNFYSLFQSLLDTNLVGVDAIYAAYACFLVDSFFQSCAKLHLTDGEQGIHFEASRW